MPEDRYSLTRVFPYKDRIVNFVLIRENTSLRKPVFWHILRKVKYIGEFELNGLNMKWLLHKK